MMTLAILLLFASSGQAQTKSLSLNSTAGLTLHHAAAAPAVLKGKKGIRLSATGEERPLGLADGIEFANGTIEADIAGEPAAGAEGGARGFVGIAFRVQADRKTYDCFYLRPANGRAEDQERRNHSAQYISHPAYTWSKLRQETPSKYESYVDIQPAEWIHVKIEVNGDKARLYVNRAAQPTLIVNDVKSGVSAKGAVALWIEGSTVAHFANLRVTPR